MTIDYQDAEAATFKRERYDYRVAQYKAGEISKDVFVSLLMGLGFPRSMALCEANLHEPAGRPLGAVVKGMIERGEI